MLAFDKIKQAITDDPILVSPSPYYPFNLFSYTTKDTISAILSQKHLKVMKIQLPL